MKKIFLLFISILLLTGCGKVNKDKLIDDFKNKVESSKAYTIDSKMEIYNAEDTFTYNIKVSYMDDDYFKVQMVNTLNNHEQIILRNNNDVYVVTPSLNKSYKFVSEWPYNSSQSYILNTLVKDLESSSEVGFEEVDGGYVLKSEVNYPNNTNLSYEKLYFSKNKDLKSVSVYDKNDIVAINVDFNKIDYKANLKENDFNVENLIDENCCNTNNGNNNSENSNNSEKTETTASLDEIVYPLYVPANTYLKGKEVVNTESGERVILTFNGEKNFILIEETSKVNDEFEIIPVYGDPLMLSNTVGALSTNSLSWSSDQVDYYLASNDLTTAEISTIAESLGVAKLVIEK